MNGIEFEKEVYKPMVSVTHGEERSLITRAVFKLSGGRIKTEEQASKVLLVVAGLLIILSIYNFVSTGSKDKSSNTVIQKQKNAMTQTMNNTKR